MLSAGLTLVVTVGLFAWGGHALDGWLVTSPLFLLVGLLLGVTGGFIHLFAVVAPGILPFRRKRRPEPPGRSDPRPPEPPSAPPGSGAPDPGSPDPGSPETGVPGRNGPQSGSADS